MTGDGLRNLITDVPGLAVGNAEDEAARTGVTVILPDSRVAAAVDVRGGAPGTSETDALDPINLVGTLDAVVLAGGSVYGLEAASGVTAWLGAKGRGYVLAAGAPAAPLVPAAILFDLVNGGDKHWGAEPPYRRLGIAAAESAATDFALGNAGAGYGAMAGAYKGGLGSVSARVAGGFVVGALVAANPVGSPVIPGTATLWAHLFERHGELGHQTPPRGPIDWDDGFPPDTKLSARGGTRPGANTTIGVVATDAALSGAELKRVAIMAQSGYARAVRPIHSPFDGDTVFAIATGVRALTEPREFAVALIGHAAADCAARALARGVYEARTLGSMPAYRDLMREGEPP